MNKLIGIDDVLKYLASECNLDLDKTYQSIAVIGLFPEDGNTRVSDFIYEKFNKDPNEWVRALTNGPILTGSTKISLVRYTLYMNMALNRSCKEFFQELDAILYFYREEFNMNL